jgi:hypothetical protein
VRLWEDSDLAASQLKSALEAVGISAFVCGTSSVGDDIVADISRALDACELFVVLGTRGFGKQGESSFSTRQELLFAVNNNKPIFLIKRCEEFEDTLTSLLLPDSMLHEVWEPCMDMPGHLVDNIRTKLEVSATPPAGGNSEPM